MVLWDFWKGIENQSPYIPKILGLNPGPLHARPSALPLRYRPSLSNFKTHAFYSIYSLIQRAMQIDKDL